MCLLRDVLFSLSHNIHNIQQMTQHILGVADKFYGPCKRIRIHKETQTAITLKLNLSFWIFYSLSLRNRHHTPNQIIWSWFWSCTRILCYGLPKDTHLVFICCYNAYKSRHSAPTNTLTFFPQQQSSFDTLKECWLFPQQWRVEWQ